MNKFMGGLTLGIIATTCFFIFFNPLKKKADTVLKVPEDRYDSVPAAAPVIRETARVITTPIVPGTGTIDRDSLITFAKAFLGTPYLYGSTDPAKGFDCSGFITHVFNHFNIKVPRSSYEFAPLGIKRTLSSCQRGDLILFTGTNPLERDIGHIGIVSDIVNGQPSFIHSSSGKANGVTITSMDNKFYQERFMDVIDILSSR